MINSSTAFIVYSIVMAGTFIFSGYVDVDLLAFQTQFTIGFSVYVTKRLIQKKKGFNGESQ